MDAITTLPSSSANGESITPGQYVGSVWPLPAPDAVTPDLLVTHTGTGLAYLSFAAGAPVGPGVAGNIVVAGGTTVLLTTTPAVLLAGANNPLVQTGQAGAWQTATEITVVVSSYGSTLLLQRVSATPAAAF